MKKTRKVYLSIVPNRNGSAFVKIGFLKPSEKYNPNLIYEEKAICIESRKAFLQKAYDEMEAKGMTEHKLQFKLKAGDAKWYYTDDEATADILLEKKMDYFDCISKAATDVRKK